MSYSRCCVPDCSGSVALQNVLHEFPNPRKDRDHFMKWTTRIGGDISKLAPDFIYKNRRVCRTHFEAKYHCRSNRLSNIAMPTINMPCLTSFDSIEHKPINQLQNLLEDPLPIPSTPTGLTSSKSMEMLSLSMDTLKIRVIMEYEFRRGSTAEQKAGNINSVYGEDTTNEHTTRYWFERFHSGNFDLKNEPQHLKTEE